MPRREDRIEFNHSDSSRLQTQVYRYRGNLAGLESTMRLISCPGACDLVLPNNNVSFQSPIQSCASSISIKPRERRIDVVASHIPNLRPRVPAKPFVEKTVSRDVGCALLGAVSARGQDPQKSRYVASKICWQRRK
jgi:hypothetical protein